MLNKNVTYTKIERNNCTLEVEMWSETKKIKSIWFRRGSQTPLHEIGEDADILFKIIKEYVLDN